MTNFEELNHYEILDIPIDASSFEISRAYRNALELYSEDSLQTYSLFSETERASILEKIERAYHTLSDRTKRLAYDASLSDKSTVADRQQDHIPSQALRSNPHNEYLVTHRDEGFLTASSEPKAGSTSQIICAEAPGETSSINTSSACQEDTLCWPVEQEDPSIAGNSWSRLFYKILLTISLFVLILLIFVEVLRP